MTRPEDIPQDVWDGASTLVHVFCGCAPGRRRANGTSHADVCWYQVQKVAEFALAAKAEERRQVIGVVLSFERHHGEPGAVASNPYADVREIAAAIRKRGG